MGCFDKEELVKIEKEPVLEEVVDTRLNETEKEQMMQEIRDSMSEFLDLMKAENIEELERLSSRDVLEALIALPVSHTESYELGELETDFMTAKMEVTVNEVAEMTVYLVKNDGWKVMDIVIE